MSKYLEIIGDDKRVVIDDKFACMEVVDSFPLSQCKKEDMSSNTASWHDYWYIFPSGHSIPDNALVGISLNGITSEVPFSYFAAGNAIRFFGDGSAVSQVGIVSIERDDIIATSTLYIFDNGGEKTPSKHGVGLEIRNDKNEIVFSSERPYINVLKCGSEGKDSVSTASTKPIIACNLGYDYYYELYQQSHHVSPNGVESYKRPTYILKNQIVSIVPRFFNTYWIGDSQAPEYNPDTGEWTYPDNGGPDYGGFYDFDAWYNYGWLIGTIC